MVVSIFQTLGGLGLFLLGMVIMTDGLQQFAGGYLHRALTRFTNRPATGALSGAISTAILQSSSATTVAAVGFVAAGLLTFPQALGIIFGANLGTTITGWLVALLGLKLKLGLVVLPLILVGVLLRLFGQGRLSQAGLALAGFSLIFVGISQMQAGMVGLHSVVTPDTFPDDTLVGRLQLVAIGIAITLVTQSSSAGVAAALTAVFTETITFSQGAAMVIGMDVGTTFTAALATIGGGLESRRTGFSHVIYNLITGICAFFLLDSYTWLWQTLGPGLLSKHAEIALVGFHTSFNLLGVLLVLPFAEVFARFIQRIIPQHSTNLTRRLERTFLKEPSMALRAIQLTLREIAVQLLQHINRLLQAPDAVRSDELLALRSDLETTHRYLDEIHLVPGESRYWEQLVHCIHTLDHMPRLLDRCLEDQSRIALACSDTIVNRQATRLRSALYDAWRALENEDDDGALKIIDGIAVEIRRDAASVRESLMHQVASGQMDVPGGIDRLDAERSLYRIAQHLNRIFFHLSVARKNTDRSRPASVSSSQVNVQPPGSPGGRA